MIETGKQATKAVKYIQTKTGWSLRIIAKKAGVNHTTLWRISNGEVENPGQGTMDLIEDLQVRASTL